MFKKKKNIIFIISGLILLIISGIIIYFNFFTTKDNKKVPVIKKNATEKIKIVDVDSKTRPYAIMINNISTAREYHSGLQDAYIVYEIIVEGGITRYLALFKDQDTEKIGSVRSARHYYIDYALENDAYFVHWGWSPQAQSDIKSLKINNINGLTYEKVYFWRDKSLNVSSAHTGYTSMEKLEKAVEKLKYRTTTNKSLLLNYSADKIKMENMEGLETANKVNIKYSKSITSNFLYNQEKEYYLMSNNNKEHIDYVTKEQYHFKNIITYQIKNSTIRGDNEGRQNINNIGKGEGSYISNGYAIPIKWEKKDRDSQTKYYYLNGKELKVNDGNTFIAIQPLNETLDIS